MNTLITVAALILSLWGSPYASPAQALPSDKPLAQGQYAMRSGKGRIYVFREVRSFGAHIDDYVTINGVPVQRVGPGTGFYCEVTPGDYVISVFRHKTYPLKVSVAAGQRQYICVMLHHLGGVAPRGGALTSDQSFDVRLLEPGYGAQLVKKYRTNEAKCQR